MILTFLIAWTPYSAFALIEQFASPDIIGPGAAVLPALFAKTSICYNPIIYVGMNTQVSLLFTTPFTLYKDWKISFTKPKGFLPLWDTKLNTLFYYKVHLLFNLYIFNVPIRQHIFFIPFIYFASSNFLSVTSKISYNLSFSFF